MGSAHHHFFKNDTLPLAADTQNFETALRPPGRITCPLQSRKDRNDEMSVILCDATTFTSSDGWNRVDSEWLDVFCCESLRKKLVLGNAGDGRSVVGER